MQLFYTPDITIDNELPDIEAQHAICVLRLKEGDEVRLTDGKGTFYNAVISSAHPKHCQVEITEQWLQSPLWKGRIHIAVAPTKNMDRMEWFAEKATEIGIDEITFLECRFSERRELKLSRIEKIVVSAMKQSRKATLPRLNGMIKFQDFIRQLIPGNRFIAHCETGEKPLLQNVCRTGQDNLIMIGPEGDFSPQEIELALQNNFQPISLGESRLRTETAALVACHTFHLSQ